MWGTIGRGVISRAALTVAWLAVAATCSSEQPANRDAGVDHSIAVSGSGGTGVLVDGHVATDDSGAGPPNTVVFPHAPQISCDDSGADGGGCDVIPSVCEVPLCEDGGPCALSRWMRSYANPRCVGGTCVWDLSYYECQDRCVSGGCLYNGTTLP
jgi:hypothetical protein